MHLIVYWLSCAECNRDCLLGIGQLRLADWHRWLLSGGMGLVNELLFHLLDPAECSRPPC